MIVMLNRPEFVESVLAANMLGVPTVIYPVGAFDPGQLGEDAIRKRGSVGKVIPTVAARVVDDNMNDVVAGEVGEIVYRAPTSSRSPSSGGLTKSGARCRSRSRL